MLVMDKTGFSWPSGPSLEVHAESVCKTNDDGSGCGQRENVVTGHAPSASQ